MTVLPGFGGRLSGSGDEGVGPILLDQAAGRVNFGGFTQSTCFVGRKL